MFLNMLEVEQRERPALQESKETNEHAVGITSVAT